MSDNPALRLTGEQLRALRDELKLTQNQVARLARAKISPRGDQCSAVIKWENGANRIPPVTAELLLSKFSLLRLGVPIEKLIGMPLHVILEQRWAPRRKPPPQAAPSAGE